MFGLKDKCGNRQTENAKYCEKVCDFSSTKLIIDYHFYVWFDWNSSLLSNYFSSNLQNLDFFCIILISLILYTPCLYGLIQINFLNFIKDKKDIGSKKKNKRVLNFKSIPNIPNRVKICDFSSSKLIIVLMKFITYIKYFH